MEAFEREEYFYKDAPPLDLGNWHRSNDYWYSHGRYDIKTFKGTEFETVYGDKWILAGPPKGRHIAYADRPDQLTKKAHDHYHEGFGLFDENPCVDTRRTGRFRFVGWAYSPGFHSVSAVFEDPEGASTGFFFYTSVGQHAEAGHKYVTHLPRRERWVSRVEAEKLDPSTVTEVTSMYGRIPGVGEGGLFDENPVDPPKRGQAYTVGRDYDRLWVIGVEPRRYENVVRLSTRAPTARRSLDVITHSYTLANFMSLVQSGWWRRAPERDVERGLFDENPARPDYNVLPVFASAPITGYMDGGRVKERFLNHAANYLRTVGRHLLARGMFEQSVHINRGGVAVSGEVYGEFRSSHEDVGVFVEISSTPVFQNRPDSVIIRAVWRARRRERMHTPEGRNNWIVANRNAGDLANDLYGLQRLGVREGVAQGVEDRGLFDE